MTKRKVAKGAVPTPAQLDKLIEEAIVDLSHPLIF